MAAQRTPPAPDTPEQVPDSRQANPPPAPDPPRPSATRQRAEAKREAKLEDVREQVESGSLVIRQMTDEERERYPPRPAGEAPRRRGRWG